MFERMKNNNGRVRNYGLNDVGLHLLIRGNVLLNCSKSFFPQRALGIDLFSYDDITYKHKLRTGYNITLALALAMAMQ